MTNERDYEDNRRAIQTGTAPDRNVSSTSMHKNKTITRDKDNVPKPPQTASSADSTEPMLARVAASHASSWHRATNAAAQWFATNSTWSMFPAESVGRGQTDPDPAAAQPTRSPVVSECPLVWCSPSWSVCVASPRREYSSVCGWPRVKCVVALVHDFRRLSSCRAFVSVVV